MFHAEFQGLFLANKNVDTKLEMVNLLSQNVYATHLRFDVNECIRDKVKFSIYNALLAFILIYLNSKVNH
jgi:hypothetical protein